MFVPSFYRPPDSSWMIEIVENHPLALLTSNGPPGGVPFATHLPAIPKSLATESADLSGSVLLCHLNRGNPHWSALETGDAVLLTFTGPHGYVTPTVYAYTPAAPTWNFTSVHVRGITEKIESADETLEVVMATVRAFESRFGSDWDMTGSIDYFRKIQPAVGAFRVHVTGADGMFKLSQEQSSEVRDRVRRSFDAHPVPHCHAVAGLMDQLP
ncbi:FMN-binding negative transcriptional regulator [Actinoalloteichus sp. GBA129-24]|uniref:FMN-binding negative transcriptional regulator n=1 Tax=Actinoalloteichus sp. GBA129-24 TaxID=1612551 RepID=UPI0009507EB2|nr:FMN-binding negative transcriptional regulator [Actinoalloteichus sp. GBA129-24]APU21341.1 negative transcriptional regulator, PaiB family [Actinoalloteichus sp. GBA129-24]